MELHAVRIDFDWDVAKAASNVSKHGVTFEEAMTVFRDPLARSILDRDSSFDEERWVTLGEASTGNLLVVVHTGPTFNPIAALCVLSPPDCPRAARRGSIARI
jgi:uncharacterized DUF497 family protein